MTIEFKSAEQVADEYLLHLKSLKPNLNTNQTDSDWYIKGQVTGSVVSGVYSDLRRIADDAFAQTARREAVRRHLEMWLNETDFRQPTNSNGQALIKGPNGATGGFAAAGTLSLVYQPNGNTYVNTADVTVLAATGTPVAITSIGTGQIQNLLQNAPLTISSPPTNIDSSSSVYGAPLADGKDVETTEEASARVLARVRESIRGGTSEDYRQWAIESDPAVVSANILRYPQGFGSVGIIISAGTTDIDAALNAGLPIVLIPSLQLIQKVQAYIDSKRPLTDYAIVYSPVQTMINVTVKVKYAQGTGTTIVGNNTLTQAQLVEREIKRAIYKTPAGGRQIGASGYVVASEIEEVMDLGLSTSPYTVGTYPILMDRQVQDLSASGANRMILNNEIAVPGVITIVEL